MKLYSLLSRQIQSKIATMAWSSIAILFFMSSTSMALQNLNCNLDESVNDAKFELPLTLDLSQRTAGKISFTSLGRSTMGSIQIVPEINGDQTLDRSTIAMIDPYTQKAVRATFGANEGQFARLMLIPNPTNTDSLQMDCQRDGAVQSKPAPHFLSCTLTEIAGSSKFDTKFEVAIATSGHDIQAIPQPKLARTTGWVLGYDGNVVMFLQNSVTYTGITAIGSWDSKVNLSWYSDKEQNIQSILECAPVRINIKQSEIKN